MVINDMENKQTAVEWLLDQLEKHNDGDNQWFSKAATKNRALRMEKEQIINANDSGFEDGVMFTQIGTPIYDTPEQYYNDTYGK